MRIMSRLVYIYNYIYHKYTYKCCPHKTQGSTRAKITKKKNEKIIISLLFNVPVIFRQLSEFPLIR